MIKDKDSFIKSFNHKSNISAEMLIIKPNHSSNNSEFRFLGNSLKSFILFRKQNKSNNKNACCCIPPTQYLVLVLVGHVFPTQEQKKKKKSKVYDQNSLTESAVPQGLWLWALTARPVC